MNKPTWRRHDADNFTTTWNGTTYTLARASHAQWWLHKGDPVGHIRPEEEAVDGAWRSIPKAKAGAALALNGWQIWPPSAPDGEPMFRRGDVRRRASELLAELES